jgi:site-specific DNA-cytosine methylase
MTTVGIYYACFGHWTLACQRAKLKVLWHVQPDIYSDASWRGGRLKTNLQADSILHANWPNIETCSRNSWVEPKYMMPTDVIVGSPPCVGLSQANPQAGIKHPANKNILEFWSFVNDRNPKLFVMEMVPQILTIGKPILVKAQRIIRDKYNVAIGEYEAECFGSPSRRHRIYFIGVQRLLDKPKDHIVSIAESLPRLPIIGIEKIIDNLSDKYDRMKPDNRELMSRYDSKGRLRSGPYSIITKRGNKLCLSPKQPSFTITGTSYCNALHWTENRYEKGEYRFLGRLEIQRLMGFPDDYDFNPTKRKLQAPTYSKLIASGVQIDFTTNLLKHVVRELKL